MFCWPGVARRQVTFLLLRQKKSNQRKGDPTSPNSPKYESAGRAAKNSACFWMFKESRPQAPSPLIRPADPDFGGAERGKVKIPVEEPMVQVLVKICLRNETHKKRRKA